MPSVYSTGIARALKDLRHSLGRHTGKKTSEPTLKPLAKAIGGKPCAMSDPSHWDF